MVWCSWSLFTLHWVHRTKTDTLNCFRVQTRHGIITMDTQDYTVETPDSLLTITSQKNNPQWHKATRTLNFLKWRKKPNKKVNFITFLMILTLISYCCQVGAVSFNKRVHQINIGILTIKIVGQSAFLGLSVDIEV